MIDRWLWLRAYRRDLETGIEEPRIRAEFILRYNTNRFWWMKELKDENSNCWR